MEKKEKRYLIEAKFSCLSREIQKEISAKIMKIGACNVKLTTQTK